LKIIGSENTITETVALTVGSFDGVHLGHKALLQQLQAIAKQNGLKTAVMTFEPHPKIFFNPAGDFKLLNTLDEKIKLLQNTGIDYLIVQDFNKEFASLSPEKFIEKLINQFQMKHLLMGYDHHFGKNRSGNFEYIRSLEKKYPFKTSKILAIKQNGENISSSLIRRLLNEGKIEQANKLLGYPYFVTGKVVSGNRIGNKLGFPTANIEVENKYKLVPKQGVYLVKSIIDNIPYYGMMNIGIRPTIDGTKEIREVHFFDFDQDIYGKNIQISFLKRLRDEKKFDSLKDLTHQLHLDKQKSLEYIEKLKDF